MANSTHWRWFPFYFVASITLAITAISSALHYTSNDNNTNPQPPITHHLSINASNALRQADFTLFADLLHLHQPPQNSTLFAIKNTTTLPLHLLLYHTTPSKTTFHDLLSMSPGTCLTTLFPQKNLVLTNIDPLHKSLEINHVLISHPDLFVDEQLTIHGVLAPFSPLRQDWDFIRSPTCRFHSSSDSTSFNDSRNGAVDWNRVVQLLGSKGYVSFSIALHSVLDGIRKDPWGLGSATIFAPREVNLLGYPSALLDRAVRLHILPQRFSYQELVSLPARTLLKTLMPDDDLEVDGVLGFMPGMVIDGVQIVEPDMFSSEKYVVHGISRAFKMDELFTA